MTESWDPGTSDIRALLERRELERLTGDAANGHRQLAKARTTLETARAVVERDPDSAFVLAYDAARQALTALLAQQGLRPTSKGGHLVVEQAARSQFGDGFRPFAYMRRRRNELEYPDYDDDAADIAEAVEAVEKAENLVKAAEQLIDKLGIFR
jgi:uncharacterized protein (UPF0332 family)